MLPPTSSLTPRVLRCAIYTRKSSEEGLEQDFNSLDAQREAAEAYILSQRQEGWVTAPHLYNDGGFTGANMGRPALVRLMDDIEAGKIDCVVVYKVDRLSRSLLDFRSLNGRLSAKGRAIRSRRLARKANGSVATCLWVTTWTRTVGSW
jgi:site-specific DNA recombinase